MAPPTFPNGMTLHTIGFATLKYPDLPPELSIPLNNQLGVLQRLPLEAQNQAISQIASQYLPSLLTYQTTTPPPSALADKTSPQHYTSSALILLNYLTTNPDVCRRVVAHPSLLQTIITQLLSPDFIPNMRAANRTTHPNSPFPGPTFESDFGTLLQFLSTLLLHVPVPLTTFPQLRDLVPKLGTWKREFRGSVERTIGNAAERLVGQIEGRGEEMYVMMREMQDGSLRCGVLGCGVRGREQLTVCKGCEVQRYCGREHQKADWRWHKGLCGKGLVEVEGGEGS